MLVNAHAIALADQKAVVGAGVDVLVHTVQNEKLDDELLALLRQHKPYWTTVIGLGDRTEVCNNDPFVDQSYPDSVLATIRQTGCGPVGANNATREQMLANNVPLMVANGARLVLGTDAGISSRYAFGWADHHEIARWVQLGLTPAQAIVGATSRAAELVGLKDLGTIAPGKSADFIVLTANPLDDIHNTRQIADVLPEREPARPVPRWRPASRRRRRRDRATSLKPSQLARHACSAMWVEANMSRTLFALLFALQGSEFVGLVVVIVAACALLVPYLYKEIRRGKAELGPQVLQTEHGTRFGAVTPTGAGDNHPGTRNNPAPGQPDAQADPYGRRAQHHAPPVKS